MVLTAAHPSSRDSEPDPEGNESYKTCGIGRELGPEGLDYYLETKVIAGV